ncbi:MAG: hypothetical protein WAT74_12670 [Flavobacteriales bacterium]
MRLSTEFCFRRTLHGSILLGLDYGRIPAAFAWDLVSDPNSVNQGVADLQPEPVERYGLINLRAGYEHTLLRLKRTHLSAQIGVGVSHISTDEGTFSHYKVTESGDLALLATHNLEINSEGRPLPTFYGALTWQHTFSNLNELCIGAYSMISLQGDEIRTTYVIDPLGPEARGGSATGSLSHAGLYIAYTMSWGYPKLPRWLRATIQ